VGVRVRAHHVALALLLLGDRALVLLSRGAAAFVLVVVW
jgi:hypothetical protein